MINYSVVHDTDKIAWNFPEFDLASGMYSVYCPPYETEWNKWGIKSATFFSLIVIYCIACTWKIVLNTTTRGISNRVATIGVWYNTKY